MCNLSSINMEDIDKNIIKLKKELMIYRIKKASKQTIKPHIIKKTKYQIAKILTLKTLNSITP